MNIYRISLPKEQDAEGFVKFIQDEYFPAVCKEPTRTGKLTDRGGCFNVLLQAEPEDET